MKEHMSITLDTNIARILRKHAIQEKRSISQVVEIAVETFLSGKQESTDSIVSSKGSFYGTFSREDTYKR